jgi:16S rRNA (guanine(966)-N(2))-methyltransferase RsmD
MRGRRLHAPRGERTRPTSGRLKKSLFDVLAWRLPDARVLDLYAGSGALAFEALSRGSAEAVVVERNRKACDSIRRNAAELRLAERVEILTMDVASAVSKLRHRGDRFDVIFADPPYRSSEAEDLLVHLGDGLLFAKEGILVLEHHHKRELRDRYGSLSRLRVLKAGESTLTLFGSE